MNEGLSDSPSDALDYSLKQDIETVLAQGKRIAGAMIRYFEHAGKAAGDAPDVCLPDDAHLVMMRFYRSCARVLGLLAETFNALLLSKSLRQKLWTDSQLETRQLPGIGPQIAQRLAAAGVHKLSQLAAVEPRRLEAMAQRHYPFGGLSKLERVQSPVHTTHP